MPGPLSETETSTLPPELSALTHIVEPAGVYLTALFKRFMSTCSMSHASMYAIR